MENMTQLDYFREQLNKSEGETSGEKKRMKKKDDAAECSVRVPAGTLRDARVLSLWLSEKGQPHSLSFIFADALEFYIDNKYPEAREGVRIDKKTV